VTTPEAQPENCMPSSRVQGTFPTSASSSEAWSVPSLWEFRRADESRVLGRLNHAAHFANFDLRMGSKVPPSPVLLDTLHEGRADCQT